MPGDRSTPTSQSHIRPECCTRKPGAATESSTDPNRGRAACIAHSGLEQQLWPAVVKPLDQRPLEARRVLVEQPTHIGRGHRRRRLTNAEPGQMQARAMIVLGIGVARRFEGSDGARPVAGRSRMHAERKPRGGEPRRQSATACASTSAAAGEIAALEHGRAPIRSAGRRPRSPDETKSDCAAIPDLFPVRI